MESPVDTLLESLENPNTDTDVYSPDNRNEKKIFLMQIVEFF